MITKDPFIFIKHMLESINDIDSFILNVTKEEFSANKEKINATIRSIEIIGEAAKNLPTPFKNKYPDIVWKEIVGTRDILIHHYFGIDIDLLWNIIKKDLPILKRQIIKIKD